MWWAIAALLLGVVETQTATLVAAMLAGGAAAGAIAALVGAPVAGQLVVFAAVAALLLLVVRPIARRHTRQPAELRTGVDALIGRDTVVVERVDARGGRVKIGGEVWSARCMHPDASFDVGATP